MHACEAQVPRRVARDASPCVASPHVSCTLHDLRASSSTLQLQQIIRASTGCPDVHVDCDAPTTDEAHADTMFRTLGAASHVPTNCNAIGADSTCLMTKTKSCTHGSFTSATVSMRVTASTLEGSFGEGTASRNNGVSPCAYLTRCGHWRHPHRMHGQNAHAAHMGLATMTRATAEALRGGGNHAQARRHCGVGRP